MSMIFHVLSAWFAFFLPSYSTFKALKHRPLSEPDLTHWATYWTVMGMFVAIEYVAEWVVSWIPFYWEIKTLFLLYCSLPQFQGSSYIFQTYLEPFFTQNEARIDATIASAQTESLTFLRKHLANLMEIVFSLLNKTPIASKRSSASPQNGYSAPAPATPPLNREPSTGSASGYNLDQ
ncbi:uncharacterized protein STEHIDRAFT_151901 [Stereum hirsutum FP-91666 SS1]|uniref:uncharacterized protein n=1 Tax=Stereum hirsutum (strain FP-91666) TaxID=721885 RepID=UPI000440BC24|nr:uncharacterized protein STEHIDRAFT_151901 [Stereum hirsutum FP-91666 SS1]EIM92582.1 hypothetical protein STEHIDRAFT_151901 [Stereum hirsutum FP-91666 SS1]